MAGYLSKKGVYISATDVGTESSLTYTGMTLSGLTASTVIYANASKAITSLANAAGFLKNNGTGTLSYASAIIPDGTVPLTADWNVGAFSLTMHDLTLTGHLIPSNEPNTKIWSNFEDFVGYSNSYFGIWSATNSGTGAAAVPTATDGNTRVGLAAVVTGTDNGGYAGLRTTASMINFGAGVYTFETQIKLTALSDGTDTYAVYIGFGDTVNGDQVDGVYFKYTDVGGGTPTPNWYKCTASNSNRTATSTGVAASTNWTKLKVVVNADGTSAEYFIDGVSVGVVTTNIPTTGRFVGGLSVIVKSAGTTSRSFNVDWVWIHANLSAYR